VKSNEYCERKQGCETVVKMAQLRHWSSSFREHGSRSGVLGFHESGSGVLLFRNTAPASVRFHTLTFSIVLVCLKLNGKWDISNTQN